MIFVNYPGHFIALLLFAITAVLLVLAFRSHELQNVKRWRWFLAAMQYVSIVILFLILWNPSRSEPVETVHRNSVLVFFDTSESMSLIESGRKNRLQKAIDVFKGKFKPSKTQGPEYKIYGFDRQCYFSGSENSLRRWGRQSNMHNIFVLLDKHRVTEPDTSQDKQEVLENQKVAGAVIFTDGQADDKNVNAYLSFRSGDLPIVLVGIGSKVPQSDVAIKAITVPSQVAIDTTYTVRVTITTVNLQNQPVTVELLRDDHVIDSKDLAPPPALRGDITAGFTLGADKIGSHILSARAKIAADEVNLANNTRNTMIQVVEQSKLKVLFYSEVANFNVGKIRQALAGNSRIELDLGLDAIIAPPLSAKAQMMCGYVKLPTSRAGFYDYDVIILGSCALDNLADERINCLYSFVVDRGGGLILLPGREEYGPCAWRNQKLRALIPVFFEPPDEQTWTRIPAKVELTLDGLDSKIISRAVLMEHDEPIAAYYGIIGKKSAASTLISAGDRPIVSVHRVGRGRVCLLNGSEMCNWYRGDFEDGLLQKLIAGLTAYVGRIRNVEAAVELFAERPAARTHDVKFTAYICDKLFAPVTGATVLLSIGDDVLRMDHLGRGYYAAEVKNMTDQAVIATVQAEINGELLGEKTIALDLPPVRSEMDKVRQDSDFLSDLAKRVGGRYFDAGDVDENIAGSFQPQTRRRTDIRVKSIWPKWSLLLVLCLILSANWFVRRNIGLV